MEKKKCSKCGEEKELGEFRNHKTGKQGKYAQCKACMKISDHKYYVENKERISEWNKAYRKIPRVVRRNKINSPEKVYRDKKKRQQKNIEYYKENPKHCTVCDKEIPFTTHNGYHRLKYCSKECKHKQYWISIKNNPDKYKKVLESRGKLYTKTKGVKHIVAQCKSCGEEFVKKRERYYYCSPECQKRHSNRKLYNNYDQYRLAQNFRRRLQSILKANNLKKSKDIKKAEDLVGCSLEFLVEYIESQFTDGMSWDKYSHTGIHIDHIIPCAAFDLSKIDEVKKCFHYTNLKPLWAIDNLKKGAKIGEEWGNGHFLKSKDTNHK